MISETVLIKNSNVCVNAKIAKRVDLLDPTQRDFGCPKRRPAPEVLISGNSTCYSPTSNYLAKLIEEVKCNTMYYGLTLTFKPKYHESEIRKLHKFVNTTISRSLVWKKINYILFPELTSGGNLHYHGIIYDTYQCTADKAIKHWRRKFGFVKPEFTVRNRENWNSYIVKDYKKIGLYTLHRTMN